ncbi:MULTISPECIES: hypothetical protein [unclassified Thiocapsa]|uniref:hypothetical protein n=1 Tax=unclassified Thiocapsa TaxID=2641286 RepID=UPI0035AE4578
MVDNDNDNDNDNDFDNERSRQICRAALETHARTGAGRPASRKPGALREKTGAL